MNNWIGLPEDTSEYFGFIYIIKNKHPDSIKKYYIGCKQLLKKTRLKANKSRKRDKIVWKDNDVTKYWGSSKELLSDIEKYGIEFFEKEVIELCNSKFHMKFGELCWQLLTNSLFDETFYNGIINVRLGAIPKNFVDKERNVSILNL
jgi:hypothetical protein